VSFQDVRKRYISHFAVCQGKCPFDIFDRVDGAQKQSIGFNGAWPSTCSLVQPECLVNVTRKRSPEIVSRMGSSRPWCRQKDALITMRVMFKMFGNGRPTEVCCLDDTTQKLSRWSSYKTVRNVSLKRSENDTLVRREHVGQCGKKRCDDGSVCVVSERALARSCRYGETF